MKKEITFSQQAIIEIKKVRENINDREIGGLLIGQENKTKILITSLKELHNTADKDNNYSYNILKANKLLKIEHEHNSKISYIGEWHTHNEDDIIASKEDLQQLGNAKKENKQNAIMLIISNTTQVLIT